MPQGRLEAAVEELERALEWDPASAFIRSHLAIVLVLWRRWDKAMDQARMVLELEPKAYMAHLVTSVCYRERACPMKRSRLSAWRRSCPAARRRCWDGWA
jgi:Flp pilus assembly protein TadD